MKKVFTKAAMAVGLCLSLLASTAMASARSNAEPEIQDGRMVISEAGEYTLTGSMRGTVYVDPGEGDVTLILDDVAIDGDTSAGIVAVSGDSLIIELAENSENSVSGGADSDYDAAIYSEIDMTIDGNGQLQVTNEKCGGIRAKDANIEVRGGELRILAGTSGFAAKTVTCSGGVVYVSAGESTVDPSTELVMNGGEFHGDWIPVAPVQAAAVSPAYTGADAAAQSGNGSASDEEAEQGNDFAPADPSGEMNTSASNEAPAIPNGAQSGNTQPQAIPSDTQSGSQPPVQQGNVPDSSMPGASGEMGGTTIQSSTDTAGEVVEGTTYNSAMDLEADYDNATTYTVTDEDGNVKITESGTYIVTGSSSDGSITVKKGTTGVVLILEDLDLTSTTSATLSINKNAEVQVIISGKVTLTDAENPADEYSEDADVADAYDGAAIKVKAESVVFITGDGELTINGDAKNGIKGGDDSSIIIGGDVEIDITAANDGINSNYDVAILSGDITVNAEDDGIHADHILTIGDPATGDGPDLTIEDSTEGIEATVVNIYGGDIRVTSTDDAINAANGDGVYEGELEYSYNQMGGDVTISSRTDGIDSNGNVNLIDGSASIRSAQNGGDAGIDYDGELYISGDFRLNNQSGVAGPDGMGGMAGQMSGMPGASGEMRR